MSYRPLCPWLLVALCALTAGCSSSSSGAGAADAGGTDAVADAGCQGDDARWTSLTAGPIACTKNSDCCVIVNDCINAAQIVSASSETAAKAAWPYCTSQCTHCISPAVSVFCSGGTCAGTVVPIGSLPDSGPNLMADHCGVDGQAGTPANKLLFGCGS